MKLSRMNRLIAGIALMGAMGSCSAYRAAGLAQSGRVAIQIKEPERALAYFEEVAKEEPGFVFESMNFREGVWTYIGRAHYLATRWRAAAVAFDRAVVQEPEDSLAWMYRGLTAVRLGEVGAGRRDARRGLTLLLNWLDAQTRQASFGVYWDPDGQIRKAIVKGLADLDSEQTAWPDLLKDIEWIGATMEEEVDRARRDERQDFRDRERIIRPGVSIGVGIGF